MAFHGRDMEFTAQTKEITAQRNGITAGKSKKPQLKKFIRRSPSLYIPCLVPGLVATKSWVQTHTSVLLSWYSEL
jgi:hypothetical protein